jgi:carbonic anhydrase
MQSMGKNYVSTPFVWCVLLLAGCFSEQKESYGKEVATVTPVEKTLAQPAAQSPEEALKQLIEGNLRYVHGELRMQHPAPKGNRKPFAAVVTVCANAPQPGLLFDQPAGSLCLLSYGHKQAMAAGLEDAIKAGIKALVLLGHEGCNHQELPGEGTATGVWFPVVLKQALAASNSFSTAVRNGQCKVVGAGYSPATRRVHFVGQELYQ